MVDPSLIARLDFRPVPEKARHKPGRVKNLPARLYIDKFQEHRQAYEFLQRMQELHGEGVKTIVRSLIYYRDTVIVPMEESEKKGSLDLTNETFLRARLDFQPVPQASRHTPGRVRHVSVRLYIDKYIEHREAFEFIRDIQESSGEGNKTIVRALLHYQAEVIDSE